MPDTNDLEIGMRVKFKELSLNELDKVLEKVQKIEKGIKEANFTLNGFDAGVLKAKLSTANLGSEFGKLIEQSSKVKKGVTTVTQVYQDEDNMLKKVVSTINKANDVQIQSVTLIDKIAQKEKEQIKLGEQMAKGRYEAAKSRIDSETRIEELRQEAIKSTEALQEVENKEALAAQANSEKQLQYIQETNLAWEKLRAKQAEAARATPMDLQFGNVKYTIDNTKALTDENRAYLQAFKVREQVLQAEQKIRMAVLESTGKQPQLLQFGNQSYLIEDLKNLSALDKEYLNSFNMREKVLQSEQKMTRSVDAWRDKMNNTPTGFAKFTADLTHNIVKMAEWGISAAILYGSLRMLSDGFKTLAQTETDLIHIERILPGNDMNQILQGAEEISKKYGVNLHDVLTATEGWSRKLKDTNDILTMVNASMKLVAVTDIDVETSVKSLSAIFAQFGLNIGFAGHAVDSFNILSNNLKTTAKDIAEGMAKVGSSAKLVGLDFDRTAALVAVGVETIGASGTEVGTALSRALSRFQNPTAIKELKNVGVDVVDPLTKKFKTLSQVLDDLGINWYKMDNAQREAVAKALGGTVAWNKIATIMGNYNRVIEATIMSYNSLGSADREMQMDLSTFQKKMEQLNTTVQAIVVSMGRNGLLDVLKAIVDGLRVATDSVTNVGISLAALIGIIYGVRAALVALDLVAVVSTGGFWAIVLAIGAIVAGIVGVISSTGDAVVKIDAISNKVSTVETKLAQTSESLNRAKFLGTIYDQLSEKMKTLDKKSSDYVATSNNLKLSHDELNKMLSTYNIKVKETGDSTLDYHNKVKALIDKITELERKQREQVTKSYEDAESEITTEMEKTKALIKLSDFRIQQMQKEGWFRTTLLNTDIEQYKKYFSLIGQGKFGDAFKYWWNPQSLKDDSLKNLTKLQTELNSYAQKKLKNIFGNGLEPDPGGPGEPKYVPPYPDNGTKQINDIKNAYADFVNGLKETGSDAWNGYNKGINDALDKTKQLPSVIEDTANVIDKLNTINEKYSDIQDSIKKKQADYKTQIDDLKESINKAAWEQAHADRTTSEGKRSWEEAANSIGKYNNQIKLLGQLYDQLNDVSKEFSLNSDNIQALTKFFQNDVLSIGKPQAIDAYTKLLSAQEKFQEAQQKAKVAGFTAFDKSAQGVTLFNAVQEAQNVYINVIKDIIDQNKALRDRLKAQIDNINTPANQRDLLSKEYNLVDINTNELTKKLKEASGALDALKKSATDVLIDKHRDLINFNYNDYDKLASMVMPKGKNGQDLALLLGKQAPGVAEYSKALQDSYEQYQELIVEYKMGYIAESEYHEQMGSLIIDMDNLVAEIEKLKRIQFTENIINDLLSGKSVMEAFDNAYKAAQAETTKKFAHDLAKMFEDIGTEGHQTLAQIWEDFKKVLDDFGTTLQEKIAGIIDLFATATGATTNYRGIGKTVGGIATTITGVPGLDIIGQIVGGIFDIFGSRPKPSDSQTSQTKELNKLFHEYAEGGEKYYKNGWDQFWGNASRDIQATINNIAKALGTSIDDIATAIGNAFKADSYVGFLKNWHQSLFEMTSDALIKAFMAQDAYQALYKSLQNTITTALVDGALSSKEISNIKKQGETIATQMRPLYQALDILKQSMGAGSADSSSSSSSSSYTAGNSLPVQYNNYISINSQAFMGNRDEARAFALMIGDILANEARRA